MRIRISKIVEKTFDIPNMLVAAGSCGFSFEGSGVYNIDEKQKEELENYSVPFVILDQN